MISTGVPPWDPAVQKLCRDVLSVNDGRLCNPPGLFFGDKIRRVYIPRSGCNTRGSSRFMGELTFQRAPVDLFHPSKGHRRIMVHPIQIILALQRNTGQIGPVHS